MRLFEANGTFKGAIVVVNAVTEGNSISELLSNGGVPDGNGKTMTVTDANGTWDYGINTTGDTIKNIIGFTVANP